VDLNTFYFRMARIGETSKEKHENDEEVEMELAG
jgi:hypothetical protein